MKKVKTIIIMAILVVCLIGTTVFAQSFSWNYIMPTNGDGFIGSLTPYITAKYKTIDFGMADMGDRLGYTKGSLELRTAWYTPNKSIGSLKVNCQSSGYCKSTAATIGKQYRVNWTKYGLYCKLYVVIDCK